MGLQRIQLSPGVNTNATQTLNSSGWSKSNLIRWRTGLPEKIGGWEQLSAVPVTGVARSMHSFTDLSSNNYIAIGTNSNLQILYGNNLYYITPVVHTSNVTPSFSTVIHTTSVKVTDATYSPNVGDYISINTQIAVGGIILYGVYEVITSISGTQYTCKYNGWRSHNQWSVFNSDNR